MIAKRFIDQGIKIREDFIKINNQLNDILSKISKVGMDLKKTTDELQYINNNLGDYSDPETAKLAILNKLTEVEIQGNKLSEIYKPINDKLESLKNQEEILYQNIKDTYPGLSDEEIVGEFEPHIKKII